MTETTKVTSGVQELIHRLRDEGVEAGRQKSDQILREAQEQASRIVAQANAEAEETLSKARREIETEKAAAIESLRVAIRDTELKMEAGLKAGFAAHVKRLVSVELGDREFLRQVILGIAGMAAAMHLAHLGVHVHMLDPAPSIGGSMHLLEAGGYGLLVDCGLFQGRKELRLRNWEDFPKPPSGIRSSSMGSRSSMSEGSAESSNHTPSVSPVKGSAGMRRMYPASWRATRDSG